MVALLECVVKIFFAGNLKTVKLWKKFKIARKIKEPLRIWYLQDFVSYYIQKQYSSAGNVLSSVHTYELSRGNFEGCDDAYALLRRRTNKMVAFFTDGGPRKAKPYTIEMLDILPTKFRIMALTLILAGQRCQTIANIKIIQATGSDGKDFIFFGFSRNKHNPSRDLVIRCNCRSSGKSLISKYCAIHAEGAPLKVMSTSDINDFYKILDTSVSLHTWRRTLALTLAQRGTKFLKENILIINAHFGWAAHSEEIWAYTDDSDNFILNKFIPLTNYFICGK